MRTSWVIVTVLVAPTIPVSSGLACAHEELRCVPRPLPAVAENMQAHGWMPRGAQLCKPVRDILASETD